MKKLLFVIVTLFALTLGTRAFCDENKPMDPKAKTQPNGEVAKKFDNIKLAKLIDLLNLDPNQTGLIQKSMNHNREQMVALRSKMKEATQKIDTELAKASPDPKQIEASVAIYKEILPKMSKAREDHMTEVLSILNPIQQGKFIKFQNEWPKRLRHNMTQIRERKMERRADKIKETNPDDSQEDNY